ncbi:MAG TPA: DUF881 domain-containing protein [Acidimicrobiales bacterium]|nr:DUF881 domain-containing protein [Acidimicrobiales bacterium]
MAPRAGRRLLGSPGVALAAALMAFLAVTIAGDRPADPETRLPTRYRLADLIRQRTEAARDLRTEVARLRDQVDAERAAGASRSGGSAAQQRALDEVATVSGLVAMGGPGLRVTLDDSGLDEPGPGASVNDLVIHSQDVQAVVNALWRSGAEAVSINGQRLVGTSAVLCVGNTLLLNGTVHSPPYVVSAVGATRDRFDDDRLVRRLKAAAAAFGLTFEVERSADLEIPAYRGSTTITYAQPAA